MPEHFDVRLIPLQKKLKYLATFSEDQFRDSVVRPIYLMEGMEHAKDVCGPNEEGKDAYFWVTDPIRKRCLYAVQTKKGDLNMSSKVKQNVVTAETQLRTALNATVRDGKTKQKYHPACVVLVASGGIDEAAQRYITDNIGDSRIVFQDADDLIPLIDKHMPEFWNGIEVRTLPYLKQFRKNLIEESETIDVSELGVDVATRAPITEDTYVQTYLHRFYTKPRREFGKVEEKLEIEEIKVQELLSRNEKLVLMTGEAGAGKTTTLNRLAMVLVENALQSTNPTPIPVRMTAYEIFNSHDSLAVLAGDITRSLTLDKSAAFSVDELNGGRIVLFIDGLDELGNHDERQRVQESIVTFHETYHNCRVILASRDYPFIHETLEKYPFVRFHISPISFRQAEKMITRLSRGHSLPIEAIQEMLRRLENVHGLELNPLLVTVFIATSDYARSDIPANITELFKKFTEMMLGRWHRKKSVGQQYHAPLKDFLLQRIAFRMHTDHSVALKLSDCRQIIEDELRERDHEADIELLFKEIVYMSGLVRVHEEELFFRHHLLQEFFAGRAIPSVDFLSGIVSDVWWTKAIVFYFGDNPEDSLGLTALREGIDTVIGGDEFQAAVTVGLAAQACYLMRTGEKVVAMQWVVDRLARVKEHALAEFAKASAGAEIMPAICYYLYGRDAVAAKIIGSIAEQIAEEINAKQERSDYDYTRLFWCIAGLIESRQLEKARELIHRFRPDDKRLLLALHVGSLYVRELHVTSSGLKKVASQICDEIGPKIEYLRPQVIKEIKGMLLEVRKGKVEAIDGESPIEK